MPSGLPEVTQVVGADASKYIAEYRAALAATKELNAAHKELQQTIAAGQGGGAGAGSAAADIARTNAAIREQLSILREHQSTVTTGTGATAGFGAAHAAAAAQVSAAAAAVRDHTGNVSDLAAGYEAARASIAAMAADALRSNELMATGFERVRASGAAGADQIRAFSTEVGGLRDSASDTAAAVDDVSRSIDALQTKAASARAATASAVADAVAAKSLTDIGRSYDQAGVSAGYASYRDSAIAAFGPPSSRPTGPSGSGGAGDAGGAFVGGLLGGAGGGSGGGGGGGARNLAGALNPFRGGGVQALEFWLSMSGELGATLIPALIATGAAAAVGAKGFEQMAVRGQALYQVASALGPAYNESFGKFITGGKGGGDFAAAQKQAAGGVYELGGDFINLMQSAAGGSLAKEGVQAIQMLDSSAAAATLNLEKTGTGTSGKGVADLREYGSVVANLVDTVRQLGPNMAGIGEDVLQGLQGSTGVLNMLSRDIPGGIIGTLFAGEAGRRWGGAITGGKGIIGRLLGLSPDLDAEGAAIAGTGGIGGLLAKLGGKLPTADLGAEDGILGSLGANVAGLSGAELGEGGLAGLLGGLGTSGAGLGADLGAIGASLAGLSVPELAGMGAAGYGLYRLATVQPNSTSAWVNQEDASIANMTLPQAFKPLSQAVVKAQSLDPYSAQQVKTLTSLSAIGAFGTGGADFVTDPGLTAAGAAGGWSQQLGQIVGAGPQLASFLQSIGLSGATPSQGLSIASGALVDMKDAFGANGQITARAKQMIQGYVSALQPMTQSAGAFGQDVAAQQIMSSPQMKNVAAVNQSMDSLSQLAEAGPTLMGGLAASQIAPSDMKAFAKALTSFTSPEGQAAWQSFASTSTTAPGVVTQLESFNDQLRSSLTVGALGPQGSKAAQGLMGYQLEQYLPAAKNSPAALALLMQQGAQQGVTPNYDPTKTLAENYAAAAESSKKVAFNQKQATQETNLQVEKWSDLPVAAQGFATNYNPALQSAFLSDATTQVLALRNSSLGGGQANMAAARSVQADLAGTGLQGLNLKTAFGSALQQAGISQGNIVKIEGQLKWNIPPIPKPSVPDVKVPVTADASQVRAAISAAEASGKPMTITVNANNGPAMAALSQIPKNITSTVNVIAAGVAQAQAAVNSVQGKTVTINIDEVYSVTGGVVGVGGKASPYTPAGAASNLLPAAFTKPQMQTGGLVPGAGSGDIVPAMLEPGEAIIPRYLVPLLAPILAAHRVPGFGAPASASSHFAAGGLVGDNTSLGWTLTGQQGQLPLEAAVQSVIDNLLTEVAKSNIGKQFATALTGQFTSSIKNLPTETKSIASSLVSQIGTEIGYAKNVASAAQQGQGYGTQGLISGMDVDPATGNGSVFSQMQSYLSSEQGFTSDLQTLTKDGLSKGIASQLIAAGPVQGDALAQSIMNDYGGVQGVNKLWAQIGTASKALGAQSAMSQYGGKLSPDLTSGTFVSNNVSISVSAENNGTLNLTAAQITSLTEQIQAKLLQQAKRNPKTGLKLTGKGS